jgi:hypothetical protein
VALALIAGWRLLSKLESSRKEMLDSLDGPLGKTAQGIQALYLVPHILPTLVITVGLLWGLRLLARLFLVQVHLHADAAERVVMVKTYLSLLVGKGVLEGKPAVKDDNLTIILSQLFRHESTGVFPDDSAPTLPLVEAMRIVAPSREK